jgi:hypothetical protein
MGKLVDLLRIVTRRKLSQGDINRCRNKDSKKIFDGIKEWAVDERSLQFL